MTGIAVASIYRGAFLEPRIFRAPFPYWLGDRFLRAARMERAPNLIPSVLWPTGVVAAVVDALAEALLADVLDSTAAAG